MAVYTKGLHQEIPEQTPVELPIGYRVPETLEQLIARLIQSNDVKKYVAAQGAETFEEADDFDVDEDVDMSSPYELKPMQEEYVAEKRTEQAQDERSGDSSTQTSSREASVEPEANTAEREKVKVGVSKKRVKKDVDVEVATE